MKIALWKRYTKKGREYFSVAVESGGKKEFVNCFENNKTNDKQPDFKGDNEEKYEKKYDKEDKELIKSCSSSIANDTMSIEDIPF